MALDTATRIVAVRHGETAWNVATRIQGQLDVELNEAGRWQAARVAQALAAEGLQVIYASDLARAHDTALAIGAACGLRVQAEKGLRERCFGAFEGRTWAEIESDHPAESARWRARDPDFAPAGGETLRQFYARVVDTAGQLAAAHPGETVALVAHGGVMDCLYRAAVRLPLEAKRTWQLGNAAINRLLHTAGGFGLVGWSDTTHLDAPGAARPHDEFSDGAAGEPVQQPASGSTADRVGHAA